MRRTERRRPRLILAAAALVTAGLLTACDDASGSSLPEGGTASSGDATVLASALGVRSYVALGDSFTAAPFVPTTDLAEGCFRSDGNYPSLLAGRLAVDSFADASCSGAASSDVLGRQSVAAGRGTVPPQIRAVTADADLVTVGIGGNDQNLFSTLVDTCTRLVAPTGSPCLAEMRERWGSPERVVRGLEGRVLRVLRAVGERAPDARVVLVGYPRLVSERETCPDFLLAPGDQRGVARLERLMRDSLERAAERGGADFVDMHAVSAGHEICSDDPWVNGPDTDQEAALGYHPFAEEQRAVADEVLAVLVDPTD